MKRKLLMILFTVMLILGIVGAVKQSLDYKRGNQDYSEAEQLANLPSQTEVSAPSTETILTENVEEDPYANMLKESIDLSALQEINPDVLGWIEIPGTEISYPILQSDNNDFYLNHTWKKEPNSVGSIYLECQVDPEFTDFNTIIYGHRMRDLSMFGSLKYYQDTDYWQEHPCVYIVTAGEVYRYDIFAAYNADPEDIIYGLKINSRLKKDELIQYSLGQSVIETGIVPTTYDRILTLSTCTGNGHESRWVVQAVNRVNVSNAPMVAENILGETDDVPDDIALSSADTFTPEELPAPPDIFSPEVQQKWNELGVFLQVVLFTGLIVISVIQIIISTFKLLLKKKK